MKRTIHDITEYIFLEDAPAPCDVIIIPGSKQWEHAETAARMYHAGYGQYVIPCGKYAYTEPCFMNEEIAGTGYEGNYETEAEFFKHILMKNGVPEDAIINEDQSLNTFENACFAQKMLKEKAITCKKIMLCCKAYHARRAFMTFERYFHDCEFVVVPTVSEGISRLNWYKDERKFLTVMSELEKCGRFFNDMYPLLSAMK